MEKYVVYTEGQGTTFFDSLEDATSYLGRYAAREPYGVEFIAKIIPHSFKIILDIEPEV